MKLDPKDSVLELLPAQLLRLRAAAGVTIHCDEGIAWVTQEGFARDDFLWAGESLCVKSRGVTLVETFGRTAAKLTLRAGRTGEHVTGAFEYRPAYL